MNTRQQYEIAYRLIKVNKEYLHGNAYNTLTKTFHIDKDIAAKAMSSYNQSYKYPAVVMRSAQQRFRNVYDSSKARVGKENAMKRARVSAAAFYSSCFLWTYKDFYQLHCLHNGNFQDYSAAHGYYILVPSNK